MWAVAGSKSLRHWYNTTLNVLIRAEWGVLWWGDCVSASDGSCLRCGELIQTYVQFGCTGLKTYIFGHVSVYLNRIIDGYIRQNEILYNLMAHPCLSERSQHASAKLRRLTSLHHQLTLREEKLTINFRPMGLKACLVEKMGRFTKNVP